MQHGILVTQRLVSPVPTMHWSGEGNLKFQGTGDCVSVRERLHKCMFEICVIQCVFVIKCSYCRLFLDLVLVLK